MRITNRYIMKLGGLAIAAVTRQWMSTLKYQAVFYDRAVDPASPLFEGPAIFLFWHEYIPFLFYLRGHCHVAMLLSQHQDAEWLSQAAGHMGFGTIRGSTSRGGMSALRELMRTGETMNLTITPDGPRGPRRQLAAGCIYASSRLGIPLVPIGLGYDSPWRVRSAWDQFAVPRLYSRARAVAGPKVQIPAGCEPRRCGALPPTHRADAQHVHDIGRAMGRVGCSHGRTAARVAPGRYLPDAEPRRRQVATPSREPRSGPTCYNVPGKDRE